MLNKLSKRELIFIIKNLEKYTNKYIYFKDSLISNHRLSNNKNNKSNNKNNNIKIPSDNIYYWIDNNN